MTTIQILALLSLCFCNSVYSFEKLNNIVVPDSSIASFAQNIKDHALDTSTPKGIKYPAKCVTNRCRRLYYQGTLLGEMAVTDLKNNNIQHEDGVVDIAEFIGYGEEGILGLGKATIVVENGWSVAIVPMPLPDGSRGNFGHIEPSFIDSDYEILEDYVKITYKRKGLVFVSWIDENNFFELTKLEKSRLPSNATGLSEKDTQQWQLVQRAFEAKISKFIYCSKHMPKVCKCIGDSYAGANANITEVQRLMATYLGMINGAKDMGTRIVSTEMPTGFTNCGFLKNWNLGNGVLSSFKNPVPDAILKVVLNESLLVGITKDVQLAENIDETNTKLPGTSILIATPKFDDAFTFLDNEYIASALKPLEVLEVDIKHKSNETSLNGMKYTLIQCHPAPQIENEDASVNLSGEAEVGNDAPLEEANQTSNDAKA